MYNKLDDWTDGMPTDLVPALKHIRKAFADLHWGFGWTSQRFCYALLHDETVEDPVKEYSNYLVFMQARVGNAAALRFRELLKQGTEPAIFRAFYDLYLDGIAVQAVLTFKELADIGQVNKQQLGPSHLAWAKSQTSLIIRSHKHLIPIWIRNVCDKQPYDPTADMDERIYWKSWQAPMLIIMQPSRYQRFIPERVWDRQDCTDSAKLLTHFEDDFIRRLESKLEQVAGEAALELAKQSQILATDAAAERSNEVSSNSRMHKENARDFKNATTRKLNTQKMYKGWKKAYRELKAKRPGMSDVWYAESIARTPIALGRHSDTIRKRMK